MQRLRDLPNDVKSLTKLVIEQQAALDAAEVTLLSSQLEVEKLKIVFDWVMKFTMSAMGCSKRFEATLFHCGPAASSVILHRPRRLWVWVWVWVIREPFLHK
jgi:hypothetical protein